MCDITSFRVAALLFQ